MGINLPIGCVRHVSYEFFLFVDLLFRVKTKIQQRALAGEKYRTPWETLQRLIRGADVF
jgi:hypothetical protein